MSVFRVCDLTGSIWLEYDELNVHIRDGALCEDLNDCWSRLACWYVAIGVCIFNACELGATAGALGGLNGVGINGERGSCGRSATDGVGADFFLPCSNFSQVIQKF